MTTAARTMIDIAPTAKERALGYALNQLELRKLFDDTGLQELIARHKGRRGITRLRAASPDARQIREGAEERFREEVERRGWPEPKYNAPLALPGWFGLIDALWTWHARVRACASPRRAGTRLPRAM